MAESTRNRCRSIRLFLFLLLFLHTIVRKAEEEDGSSYRAFIRLFHHTHPFRLKYQYIPSPAASSDTSMIYAP